MQRLTQPRSEGCLSDFALDELFAHELEAAALADARAHLETCGACRARLASRAEDQAAFAANAPRLGNVRSIESARARRWPLATVTALVAAAAAVFFVLRVPRTDPAGETRTKGGERLGLYVQRGGGAASQAAPGELMHPGETLQFTYTTTKLGYLAVISVDGAKRATVYFPVAPTAARIEPGRDVELSNSTVLDATLGAETAYGLFCDAPIELEPVRAAFEANPDAPPIPKGCAVDRIAFVKERQP